MVKQRNRRGKRGFPVPHFFEPKVGVAFFVWLREVNQGENRIIEIGRGVVLCCSCYVAPLFSPKIRQQKLN